MPVGGYGWMSRAQIAVRDWAVYDEDSDTDFILEVDLDYPEELHLAHASLPLAPHLMTITEENLSPFSRQLLN